MSNSPRSIEIASAVKCDVDSAAQRARTPYAEEDLQPESASKTRAVDFSRGGLWKPLYTVSLIAMVASIVLLGVSLTVDMFYVHLPPPRYMNMSDFQAVCDSGCAAAASIPLDSLFKPESSDARTSTTFDVFAQMQPFAVTSCTERGTGVLDISAGSRTTKTRGDFLVNCSARTVKSQYTDYKYVDGFTFYHAVGAPKIHRMDYLVEHQTVIVVSIMFALSGVAFVLYVAVVARRATLSPTSLSYAREGCCPCNAPHQVRRLTAAVIAFLVLSVVMTIVQLILCGTGSAPSERCDLCAESVTVTGGYWALFAIILVLDLLALSLVCACYAMRL